MIRKLHLHHRWTCGIITHIQVTNQQVQRNDFTFQVPSTHKVRCGISGNISITLRFLISLCLTLRFCLHSLVVRRFKCIHLQLMGRAPEDVLPIPKQVQRLPVDDRRLRRGYYLHIWHSCCSPSITFHPRRNLGERSCWMSQDIHSEFGL